MNDRSHNPFPAVTEGTIGDAVVQTVNARDLHAFLSVGRDFSNWIKDRIASYAFNEHSDFEIFEILSSPNLASSKSRAQSTKEYALTIDMAKELAMVERNEKGKEVRRYFIDCERRAKEAAKAKAEIDFSDPVVLLGTFRHLQGQVEQAKVKIAELQPKAQALSRIAITDGSLCITDAAKTLQVAPKWLFRWMREHEWIYGRVGTSHDVGYQAKIAAGLLEHKVTSVYRSDGTEKTVTQVRVTPKGLARLGELMPPAAPAGGGTPPQPNTLFGLVIAGMVALGLLSAPEPARALPAPAHDGLALMRISGRPVVVDTSRFKVADGEQAVRIHYDGRITIGPVLHEHAPARLGARFAMEPPVPTGRGSEAVSEPVQILGVVV